MYKKSHLGNPAAKNEYHYVLVLILLDGHIIGTLSYMQGIPYFPHILYFNSTDGLLTDEDKNIVSAITYHPFGEVDVKEGSEDYLFTGKEMDSTSLYYYGARYYDPEVGRFITRDHFLGKKLAPQSLNRYTYALNNPVRYVDLWGNEAVVPFWDQFR